MKRITLVCAAALLATATAIALTPAASSSTPPAPPSGNSSTQPTPLQRQAASVSYWTSARMAAAKPVTPEPGANALGAAPVSDAATQTLTSIPPVAGTPKLPTNVPKFTDPVARPYTTRPARLNGKVFFTNATDHLNYVCSGTLVNSANRDMVDTAGHCVAEGGLFHLNWVFVPGYSSHASGSGDAPFGIWPERVLTTRTDWLVNSNLKEDYGYGVLGTSGGWHAVQKLGGQGVYFNAAHVQPIQEFGYPQAPPFNGFDQRYTTSTTVCCDDPMGPTFGGPTTLMIKSWQTGGTSGGGWLVGVSQVTGLGHLNSHSSYRYIGGPKANPSHLYGPYYGDDALSLYNFTQVF